VVQENIQTYSKETYWKFRERWSSKLKVFLRESMKLNWNFQIGFKEGSRGVYKTV